MYIILIIYYAMNTSFVVINITAAAAAFIIVVMLFFFSVLYVFTLRSDFDAFCYSFFSFVLLQFLRILQLQQ